MSEDCTVPMHVGYIVDGNRRWAKDRGLSASQGHTAGYEKIKEIVVETCRRGVPYVSAYVFSTENWRRSKVEVDWLMELIVRMLKKDIHVFTENNIRLRIVGVRDRLSKRVISAINEAEAITKHLTGGTFIACFNYGGQQEIVDAVNKVRQEVDSSRDLTVNEFAQFLYTPDVPPCDVRVRTSGEKRLSNFMLWRSAYSEFVFLKKAWPEMTKRDVVSILKKYARRSRRFGG